MLTPTDEQIVHAYVYGSLTDQERTCLEHRMKREKPLRLYGQQLRQKQLDDARQNGHRMQEQGTSKTF